MGTAVSWRNRQATLSRADLLAALGKLVAFENGDFVSELLDDRLITMNFSVLGVDLGYQLRSQCAQLFGSHLVEIGQGSHAVDFTKAARVLQLKGAFKAM